METVYDGWDVTALLERCSPPCEIFIESYGFDQPQFSISRRLLAELRLRYRDGTVAAPLARAAAWASYDADAIYVGRLWAAGGGGHSTAQSSASGGGKWYYLALIHI